MPLIIGCCYLRIILLVYSRDCIYYTHGCGADESISLVGCVAASCCLWIAFRHFQMDSRINSACCCRCADGACDDDTKAMKDISALNLKTPSFEKASPESRWLRPSMRVVRTWDWPI
jgi:hypothetical protein